MGFPYFSRGKTVSPEDIGETNFNQVKYFDSLTLLQTARWQRLFVNEEISYWRVGYLFSARCSPLIVFLRLIT